MENILVSIDLSKSSINALKYAIHFAEYFNSKLYILYNQLDAHKQEVALTIQKDYFYREVEVEAEREIEIIKKYYLNDSKVDYCLINENGCSLESLECILGGYDINFCVMGFNKKHSHDRKLFNESIPGFLAKIKLPLLLVPEDYCFEGFKNLVFAFDFNFLDDIKILNDILFLAYKFKVKTHILQISSGQYLCESYFKDKKFSTRLKFNTENFKYKFIRERNNEKAIWTYTNQENGNILILNPQGNNGVIDRMVKRIVNNETQFYSNLPLLIMN
ncbi:universal stress protein [Chondrinema litorale]|uniref:universal stress protein n=1 Tax=Chondrinema litorale TaxID=2994555 RepID=UPI002542A2A6|nr:universal stress protein [Chondrinema litorale]UZR93720.1 universal stress protein [Chondrinema litorale]